MSDDEPGNSKPTPPLPSDNDANTNTNGNGNGVTIRGMQIDDLAIVFHMGECRHASLAPRKSHPIENMLRFGLEVIHFLESKHRNLVFNIRDLYSAPAGFAVPEGGQFSLDIHSPP